MLPHAPSQSVYLSISSNRFDQFQ